MKTQTTMIDWDKKTTVLKALKKNPKDIIHVSERLQKDKDVLLKYLNYSRKKEFDHVTKKYYRARTLPTKQIMINALLYCPEEVFDHMIIDWDDKEVILAALQQFAFRTLTIIDDELCDDAEIILEAIKWIGETALAYPSDDCRFKNAILFTEAIKAYNKKVSYERSWRRALRLPAMPLKWSSAGME